MLSAVIRNGHSYRAVPLAGQLVHHRSAHPGPLVLGATPLNSPARTLDRDRTVSQRSEPSSRTALMGEQPNPWEVLPPQDATSRHRAISVVTDGADYLSTLLRSKSEGPAFDGDRNLSSSPKRDRHLTISFEMDQSLRGHVFRQTSHGVVLMRGVHRYKPVRASRFHDVTPNLRCQTTPSL